jgi:hypothetical protein
MITIAEVIEEFARKCEEGGRAYAFRALAEKYEGCIVAEGEADAYRWVDHSGFCGSPLTRYADVAPGHLETAAVPLYRAKEPETCKPALQVEAAMAPPARRPLTDKEIDELPWCPSYENPMTLAEGLRYFARAIERAHKIGGNDD